MTAVYSLDTNLFLMAWNQTYRIGNFPGFWTRLKDLFASGRAVMSSEVLREILQKDDGVHEWVKRNSIEAVELDLAQMAIARGLASEFPSLAKERLGRQRADGFVIALAIHQGLTVVTAENHRGPEKIPNICGVRHVPSITLADMIEREAWQFGG